MALLNTQEQQEYESLIEDALSTFCTKSMTWKRSKTKGMKRYGEDSEEFEFQTVVLPVLCNYNYMRSWPITDYTLTGEADKQSIQILISKKLLKDGNYLTKDGYFSYSPAFDRFYLDGIEYKASGDTNASQAFSDDLIFSFIVIRPLKPTRDQ